MCLQTNQVKASFHNNFINDVFEQYVIIRYNHISIECTYSIQMSVGLVQKMIFIIFPVQ